MHYNKDNQVKIRKNNMNKPDIPDTYSLILTPEQEARVSKAKEVMLKELANELHQAIGTHNKFLIGITKSEAYFIDLAESNLNADEFAQCKEIVLDYLIKKGYVHIKKPTLDSKIYFIKLH